MPTLGAALTDARRSKQLTLRRVAADVEISPALLSLIERDKHLPDKALIARLGAYLSADVDQLCALVGKISPENEKHLASIAEDDPPLFREMMDRLRKTHGRPNKRRR